VAHEAEPSAYKELLAALEDHDRDIRSFAEALLHRTSPPGLRELKQRLKSDEVIAEVPNGRRVASHLQFCLQVRKWQLQR
jgi:hypothetical protein